MLSACLSALSLVNASPDSAAAPAVAGPIVVPHITPEGVVADGSLNAATAAGISVDSGSTEAAGVAVHQVPAALIVSAAA